MLNHAKDQKTVCTHYYQKGFGAHPHCSTTMLGRLATLTSVWSPDLRMYMIGRDDVSVVTHCRLLALGLHLPEHVQKVQPCGSTIQPRDQFNCLKSMNDFSRQHFCRRPFLCLFVEQSFALKMSEISVNAGMKRKYTATMAEHESQNLK